MHHFLRDMHSRFEMQCKMYNKSFFLEQTQCLAIYWMLTFSFFLLTDKQQALTCLEFIH